MKKIFCVEDDSNIRELIEYTLTSMGFAFEGFECASNFFDAIRAELPDLILLDIMLPDKDGMEILSELKQSSDKCNIPVILLTAKTSQINKIKGLDSGADDYITKPFDIMELVSRINAVLRRCKPETGNIITYNGITLDTAARTVTTSENGKITLTYKEFELLRILLQNKKTVLTRDVLMNKIWGTDFEGETRTVDVHVRTLRQKLGKYGEYIETVRNVGYKMRQDI